MKISWSVVVAILASAPSFAANTDSDIKLQPERTARDLASPDVVVRRAAIRQFVDSLDTKYVKEYNDSLLPAIRQSLRDIAPKLISLASDRR